MGQIGLEQDIGRLPEHADTTGVLHQQQADAVRKKRRVLLEREGRIEAHGSQRFLAGAQRVVEAVVELVVEFAGQPAGPHAVH